MELKKNKIKYYTNKTGKLIPFTFDNKFPIKVRRIFFIIGKVNKIRANHAHKKCSQYLYPINGSFMINILNRNGEKKIYINSKNSIGCLIKPKTWLKVKCLKKNSILMVICNLKYDPKDYIKNFKQFKKSIQ